MLKFRLFQNDPFAAENLQHQAHLVGADQVGMRSTISVEDGLILCDKRAVGPAALVVQCQLPNVGRLMLQTCLLPDREEPYLLNLELARHRLMLLLSKQEEWMLFELPAEHLAVRHTQTAREKFIEAINHVDDDPERADRLAVEALEAGIEASEVLTLVHAELLFNRRRQTGQLSRYVFGCGVGLDLTQERARNVLLTNFDYLRLPTPWRQLEPEEQEYNWQALDSWAEWAFRNRLPILAGPLISFDPYVVPDWLYIWEHDFDTVRDLLYEHIERVVTRYRNVVTLWNVVSGIHVNSHFTFNFDQLMDLTRMSVMLTKKIQPSARTLIELTHPFGEYYASNQRSIPPLMYAETVLQAGVPFDGFGLKLLMGQPEEGQATRDLMQISALLDRFCSLGKPLHITAVAVPSEPMTATAGDGGSDKPANSGGYWRKPWSQLVQSHWLEAFYQMALSKPVVESVSWLDLADHDRAELAHAGLTTSMLQPKGAFRRLIGLRRSVQEATRPGGDRNAGASTMGQ